MITIANCFDLNEALRLQMLLEAAGIPSFIPDEIMASIEPNLFLTSNSGVRLQVPPGHAHEAQRLLAEEREAAAQQHDPPSVPNMPALPPG